AHQLNSLPLSGTKTALTSAAFNADLYYPHARKDRKLVLRVSAGLPSEDLTTFMHTARLCPQHRFVLILGHCYQVESAVEQIIEQNRELGDPVEILVDLQHAERSALVRHAGIYMHTLGEREPFGMPVSIAEAMASGALLLLGDRPEARLYGGDAAHYFQNA